MRLEEKYGHIIIHPLPVVFKIGRGVFGLRMWKERNITIFYRPIQQLKQGHVS